MTTSTPQSCADITFQSSHEEKKVMDIVNGNVKLPNYGITGIMLHGIPGTGKSALAGLLAGAIDQSRDGGSPNKIPFMHNCASADNGVALVDRIQRMVWLFPVGVGTPTHYVVLDEADNLTPAAHKQLKAVMGTPDCIFILTTNNLSAFEPALLDRCVLVSFNPTDPKIWLPRLKQLAHAKGITTYTDAFFESVVLASKFSARQIMSQLQL